MTVTACPPTAPGEALSALRDGLDAVCAVDPGRLSWAEQEELVRELETARRRLDAARLRALDVFAQGGAWQDGEHLSAAGWLRGELQVPRGDAGRDLSLARSLRDWPAVAAALVDGRISARSAGLLCSALRQLPNVDEQTIELTVLAAQLWDPAELAKALAARIAAAAPDRADQNADGVHERRRLYHSITLDSMGRLDAWLEPELAELLRDALDAETVKDRGEGDTRSPAQRRHDAFGRMIRRAVTTPDAPRRHGQPVQILVLTTPEAILDEPDAPPARTAGGHVLTRGALRRLSCTSPLSRCLLAGTVPLELGRTVRTATEGQYRALVARDGGCATRGCDRPASWCTPHHIVPWQHGGPTNLDNLILICEGHHHALHDQERTLPLKDGRALTPTRAVDGPEPPSDRE